VTRTVAVVSGSRPGFPVPERIAHLRDHGWEAHIVDSSDGSGLRELVALRPRLVHFHSASVALRFMDSRADLDCKVIVTATGEDLNTVGLENPHHYGAVWDLADVVHVPSEGLWQRAVRRGCPPARRHVVIPPAADTSYFDPSGDASPEATRADRLRILSVGPLVWAQGYEHALHAARLLLDRGVDFEYRIVGEGELLPGVLFARRQLGLEDQVELLDGEAPVDLRKQLEWADVFLNAAVADGFTDGLAEAHAMGLAVVASERGVLDGGVEGEALVAPTRDPMGLAEKLVRTAVDPELRRRLGKQGRARAVSRYGLGKQLSRFDALYREVAT
jgi:glycosyltransferase involved in cell wall biosynthesis